MPSNTTLTTTAHHCLGNDPASLHRTRIDNTEPLVHWDAISTIPFHEHTVASVQLDALLKHNVHGDVHTVSTGHEHLLALEIISQNLGRASQFDILDQLLAACDVVVPILGLVDKRGAEIKIQLLR